MKTIYRLSMIVLCLIPLFVTGCSYSLHNHEWGPWSVTTTGKEERTCPLCLHTEQQNHTHTYSTTWSGNETQHWRECTGAGCDGKTGTASHGWGSWTVTTSEIEKRICSLCLRAEQRNHTHTYSATWSSNAMPVFIFLFR